MIGRFTQGMLRALIGLALVAVHARADAADPLRLLVEHSDVIVLATVESCESVEPIEGRPDWWSDRITLRTLRSLKPGGPVADERLTVIGSNCSDATGRPLIPEWTHRHELQPGRRVLAFLEWHSEPAAYRVATERAWFAGAQAVDDEALAIVEPFVSRLLAAQGIPDASTRLAAVTAILVDMAEQPELLADAVSDLDDGPTNRFLEFQPCGTALLDEQQWARLSRVFCARQQLDRDTWHLARVLTCHRDTSVDRCARNLLASLEPGWRTGVLLELIAEHHDQAELRALARKYAQSSNRRVDAASDRELVDGFLAIVAALDEER
jgi:hypothetical protein